MNVKLVLPRLRGLACLCVWACAGAAGSSLAAPPDWMEWLGTPWHDPLLTRPPQLDTGLLLPGGSAPPLCAGTLPELAQALDLQDAVDIALCQHPQLRSATASIEKSAAQVGEARAAYLPSAQLGRSETTERTHNPHMPSGMRDTERMRDSDFFTLTWRLLDFGTRDAQRRAANALLESALASRDAVVQHALAKVVATYFEAQTAAAVLQSRQEHEALAQRSLLTSRLREARGAAARSDTVQAEMALARAELDRHRAQRTQQRALAALALAMGVPDAVLPAQGLRLEPALPPVQAQWQRDLQRWLALAQNQHPSLLAARAQLRQVREQWQASRADGFPTLDFSYGLYQNGRPNQSVFAAPAEQTVSSVTLKIPLFEGFSRTYKVRGAAAQVALKEAELQETENRVLAEVREAHADAESAVLTLAASQTLQDSAQDAVQLVQQQYDRGVLDILALLGVQRSLSEAQQERIRALSDWHSARLRLLAQVGGLGRGLTPESVLLLPEP